MSRHPARSRRRVPLPDGIEHGTVWAYDYYRCGCGDCRAAKTAKAAVTRTRRAQRQEMFPQVPTDPPPPRFADWMTAELIDQVEAGPREGWEDEAGCRPGAPRPDWARDLSPADFYDEAEGDVPTTRVQGYCRECPVRADCIASALSIESQSTMNGWWGSSPHDRRVIRAGIRRGLRPVSDEQVAM